QLAEQADDSAMRIVESRVLEVVIRGRGSRSSGPSELLDEIGSDPFRIEKTFQLDVRELLNLLFGVVDAALLLNARANLTHDLLDVDRVGSNVDPCHGCSFPP